MRIALMFSTALLATSAIAQETTKSETQFLPSVENCKSVCELAKKATLAGLPDPARQSQYFACFMKRLCTAEYPIGLPLAHTDTGSLGLPVPAFKFLEQFMSDKKEFKG